MLSNTELKLKSELLDLKECFQAHYMSSPMWAAISQHTIFKWQDKLWFSK